MPQTYKKDEHPATTEERVPSVFGINRGHQQQRQGVWFFDQRRCIHGGTGDPRQLTLSVQRQGLVASDPPLPVS